MFWKKSTHALERKLNEAPTYQEWTRLATQRDRETGQEDWRLSEPSDRYDYRAVRQRFEHLRALRTRGDLHGLMFALYEGIHGNLAGMGKASLYSQALQGTKQLIHDYIEEVCASLEAIEGASDTLISQAEKEHFFRRASHCFGRSALMLSGAGALGYFHAGVLKALLAEGLLPDIISGSSAGSVMAAIVCCHTADELPGKLEAEFLADSAEEEARKQQMRRPRIKTQEVIDYLNRVVPDLTFDEAYLRTGRKLNVTVTGLSPGQAPRLLNATTAPNVMIRSALAASCAVYGLYPPVTLQAKNAAGEIVPYLPDQQWIDGSFADDLPAKRLGRLYGVNHFISSMANPAVLLFTPNPDASTSLVQ